ncbi:MAG TPA: hypothetical protein VGM56_30610 [Byssovorax sp.]
MSASAAATTARSPDCEGLLAALVLDPSTYSRNRFFELYKDPAVRRARRRAAMLRSVLRHLGEHGRSGARVAIAHGDDGGAELTYTVESLGLRRTLRLDPLELALLRVGLGRAGERGFADLGVDEATSARVNSALERLAPR